MASELQDLVGDLEVSLVDTVARLEQFDALFEVDDADSPRRCCRARSLSGPPVP